MHIRGTSIADTTLSSIIHLHDIEPTYVTADIRLYIRTTLEKSTAGSTWYDEIDVYQLARLSGGLFIFASTALAYILRRTEAPGRSERLRTLKTQTSGSTLATGPLDDMYLLVLTQASDPKIYEAAERDEMRRIIAVILSTRAPLTLKSLAEVLGLTTEHLRGALEGLHAVISVPKEDDKGPLRALHASFGDFICTRAPEHIRIAKEYGNVELARTCLERMDADDLCFNISRATTSYGQRYDSYSYNHVRRYYYSDSDDDEDDNDDDSKHVYNSSDNVNRNFIHIATVSAAPSYDSDWIAKSLIYACLHWAHHVSLASAGQLFDDKIDSTLRRKLLFWLELLSVVGEVRHASSLLRIAATAVIWCPVLSC